jgi:hypothetical protein
MDVEDLLLSGSEVMMRKGEKGARRRETGNMRDVMDVMNKRLEIKRKQKAKRWYMQQKDTLEMLSRTHGSLTILGGKR